MDTSTLREPEVYEGVRQVNKQKMDMYFNKETMECKEST